jgi:acyl-coenzyme A synthetase/AMP-(fatty) acid ligase/acyl carrier protein
MGLPKSVMVTHCGLGYAVRALASALGLNSDDVLASSAAISSDRLAPELLLSLASGARVELLSNEDASDVFLLSRRIEQVHATAMQATPLTWRMLLESGRAALAGIKALCGGEILSDDVAADLIAGGATPWNLYGSVETTLWSAAKRFAPQAPITIGNPFADTRAHVFDEYLQPTPEGVLGELYIGGPGVTRGYRNRPDLTAERFVPDPLATEPGGRIYRTGDVVRHSPHGELCFKYRLDHQAVIRGFRVRLGEIEALLAQHPEISQAAVTVRGAAADRKNVVAFVVPQRAATNPAARRLSVEDVSEFLRMQLPDYMMPSSIIILEAFPQLASGKLNRRGLPDPEPSSATQTSKSFQAPASETEKVIARIWSHLLQLDRISVNDDFFDLGGDSLKAQKMLVQVVRELGVTLTVRTAFASPTIAQLVLHIDRARRLDMTEEEELRGIINGLSDEEVHALLSNVTSAVQ